MEIIIGRQNFPPEQFYIDQIIKVSEIYDHLPIFLQIFTG